MASAYKSAIDYDSSSDVDSVDEINSDQSSSTVYGDSHNGANDTDGSKRTTEPFRNAPDDLKNRLLMLTSRGVSYRHRHLLADLHSLLPHSHKDTKLDTKSSNSYNAVLNSLADLHSCNYVFFLEARKHGQDLYLWLSRPPNGPTVKFSVSNVHTMGELGFGGNCLKGGRGIVVFDKSFDSEIAGQEYRALLREMLRGVFCVPAKGIRGMKPFIDRITGIYGLDGKIWVRVYEVRETGSERTTKDPNDRSDITLVEIGPRMVLTPVVILEGSFGGPVIFENKQFVSPNQIRSDIRMRKASKYINRVTGAEDRGLRKNSLGLRPGQKRKGSGFAHPDKEISALPLSSADQVFPKALYSKNSSPVSVGMPLRRICTACPHETDKRSLQFELMVWQRHPTTQHAQRSSSEELAHRHCTMDTKWIGPNILYPCEQLGGVENFEEIAIGSSSNLSLSEEVLLLKFNTQSCQSIQLMRRANVTDVENSQGSGTVFC